MESVLKVLGDYERTVRAESLAQKQFTNSQPPSEDIARLKGIRLCIYPVNSTFKKICESDALLIMMQNVFYIIVIQHDMKFDIYL